jgi:hypothetical protein
MSSSKVQQQQQVWEDDFLDDDYDYDKYESYGDYSVTQTRGGGGGCSSSKSKSKTDKRHIQRGGGATNVYSSKHIRSIESRIASRK